MTVKRVATLLLLIVFAVGGVYFLAGRSACARHHGIYTFGIPSACVAVPNTTPSPYLLP
jgi:hypothetical protein